MTGGTVKPWHDANSNTAGNTNALGGTAPGGTTINGGTLDINGTNLSNENITVQGTGVGGNGAIVTTVSSRTTPCCTSPSAVTLPSAAHGIPLSKTPDDGTCVVPDRP